MSNRESVSERVAGNEWELGGTKRLVSKAEMEGEGESEITRDNMERKSGAKLLPFQTRTRNEDPGCVRLIIV